MALMWKRTIRQLFSETTGAQLARQSRILVARTAIRNFTQPQFASRALASVNLLPSKREVSHASSSNLSADNGAFRDDVP
jgi:hypothetical protein